MALDPEPQPRPLTPEEAELLVRVMTDEATRERVFAQLRETYLNPEAWRALGRAVRETYLDPELWRAAWQAFERAALDPEVWRAAFRTLSTSAPDEARAALDEASAALDARGGREAADAFADAAQQLDELLNPRGQLEHDDLSPLGTRLSGLPLPDVLQLLGQTLAAIAATTYFTDSMAETDVSPPITYGLAMVAAIAVLLATILRIRTGSGDDEPPR